MLIIKLLLSLFILLAVVIYLINHTVASKIGQTKDNPNAPYQQGRFRNTVRRPSRSLGQTVALWVTLFTKKKVNTRPHGPIPIHPLRYEDLKHLSNDTIHIVKLGHSSVLLKVYGEYWLLDPVFSKRASPCQFIGPQRFHKPPISLEELPKLDKILISHNHYDHLDKASIQRLNDKTEQFFVPLGVDGDLQQWGVLPEKITTFDWWQEVHTNQGMVAYTPSQHFSGRGLNDGNRTLWGSWVIKTPQHSLYFSGDSGYFAGFKAIGEHYGPFDLTMIETGAYDDNWPHVHMKPEDSVQTHIDLQGRIMVPIHNATFDLAFHAWHEPYDRVLSEAKRRDIVLSTPMFGQVFSIEDTAIHTLWWQPDH